MIDAMKEIREERIRPIGKLNGEKQRSWGIMYSNQHISSFRIELAKNCEPQFKDNQSRPERGSKTESHRQGN